MTGKYLCLSYPPQHPLIIRRYHIPAPSAGLVPTPDSTLINGKGRYVGGPEVERTVLKVQSGKRYRFRVINTSAIGSYTFAIEGHTMTIIVGDIQCEPLEAN